MGAVLFCHLKKTHKILITKLLSAISNLKNKKSKCHTARDAVSFADRIAIFVDMYLFKLC